MEKTDPYEGYAECHPLIADTATGTSTATNAQALLSQLTAEVSAALKGLTSPVQSASATTPSMSGLTGILQSLGLTSPLSYASPGISSAALSTTSGAWGSAAHADAAIIGKQNQIAGTEARIMSRLNQLGLPPAAAVSAGLGAAPRQGN